MPIHPGQDITPSRTKLVTRERILAAAPDVLRRAGFTGFALEEVAKAAGVARQTIYNHFGGREDLFAALLVKEMFERHAPVQTELGGREPSVDNLVEIFLAELEAGRQYALFDSMLSPVNAPRMAEVVFGSVAVAAARETAWLPILERYAEKGLLREGLDLRETVRWITYQQFWFLTHPGTLCGDDRDSVGRVIRTYIVPALIESSDS